MKTALLEFGNIKITFLYGSKVNVSLSGVILDSINNAKAFREFAKGYLNENQIRIAKQCMKSVR